MSADFERLESVLRERERLRRICIYFEGASERSPLWDADEQAAWDDAIRDLRDADRRLLDLAAHLRSSRREDFARWIGARRALHERRLAEANLPPWERDHRRATIVRWQRFLEEEDDEFCNWTSW